MHLQGLQRLGRRAGEHAALFVETRAVAWADNRPVDDTVEMASQVRAACRPRLHTAIAVAVRDNITGNAQTHGQIRRQYLGWRLVAHAHPLQHRPEGQGQWQWRQKN